MRARLGIEAGSGKPQPLDRPAMDEMLSNDFIHIFEPDKAVPDGLGIDHDGWPMLTLIEAAGLIGADEVLEPCGFDGILESGFDLLASLWKTARPRYVFVALVGADKEVTLKFRHWRGFLLCLFATWMCDPRSFLRQYEIDAT